MTDVQAPPAPRARADLEALWLPFTANRQFKARPRLLAQASGMYYWTIDDRQILDGVAGLWCVNAGHARREITQAVAGQDLVIGSSVWGRLPVQIEQIFGTLREVLSAQ